jgi:hypothetical protein
LISLYNQEVSPRGFVKLFILPEVGREMTVVVLGGNFYHEFSSSRVKEGRSYRVQRIEPTG